MDDSIKVVITLVLIVLITIYVLMSNSTKSSMSSKENKERFQRIQELEVIASTVDKLIFSMNESDDLKAKKKRAETILQSLNRASEYPERYEVFDNFDLLYEQVKSMFLVAPVIEHLKKAHKFKFKKKDSSEKNALLDAMYEIEQHNITDDDFLRLGSHNEETGEIISISQIKERLKELGWEK